MSTIYAVIILLSMSGFQPHTTTVNATEPIYICDSVTYDQVSHREGKLLVERMCGQVVDDNGSGRIFCDSEYNYISYEYVPGAEEGKTVITYCVYNPYNNFEDDISLRLDFVL